MDKNVGRIGIIIPAAGSGARIGGKYKPLEKLCDKEIVAYSLEVFEKCHEVAFVVISAREDKVCDIEKMCKTYGFSKVKKVVCGGCDRQSSVESAFCCGLFDDENITHVAIHDAVRPIIDEQMAKKVFCEAFQKGNAVCATKIRDTVKRTDDDNIICEGVERDNLWLIQTPQVFNKESYKQALKYAKEKELKFTDDSSLLCCLGQKVNLCNTSFSNIKITYPEDIFLAEAIINYKKGESQ